MKLPYKVMSSAALSVVVASIPVIVHAQAGDFYNQTKQLKYSQSDLRSNATLANKLQDEMDNGDTIIKEVTTGQYLDYVKANDAFINIIANGGDTNTALTEAITAGATSATSDELNGYTPATPDEETLAVSSVSAITTTGFTINFDSTADLTVAGLPTTVTLTPTSGSAVTGTITYNNTAKTATVSASLTAGTTYTATAIGLNFGTNTIAVPAQFAVSSVTAPNLKQIQITFNKEVDKTTAEIATNYEVYDNGSSTAVAGTYVPKLQSDNKTVILTLVNDNTTKLTNPSTAKVVVKKAIKDANLTALTADYTNTAVSVSDTTAPVVTSVTQTATNKIKVAFSEAVIDTSGGLTVGTDNFKVDNGAYVITGTLLDLNTNTIELTLGGTISEGSHTLTVNPSTTSDLVDFAGFKVVKEYSTSFNIGETVAPTATIKSINQSSVTYKFSGKVNNVQDANVAYRHSINGTQYEVLGNSSYVTVDNTNDWTEVTVDFAGAGKPIPSGTANLYIAYRSTTSGSTFITDNFGNDFAVASYTATVTEDTKAPTVTAAFVSGSNTQIDVTYDEAVTGADSAANYTLKDSSGSSVTLTGSPVRQTGNVYRLTAALPLSGSYTLEIKNIKDKAVVPNAMATTTLSLSVADTIKPTIVDEAGAATPTVYTLSDAKNVQIFFSEAMNTADLSNINNYQNVADSNANPISATPSADGKSVVLIFANNVTNGNGVIVGQLSDASGNKMAALATTVSTVASKSNIGLKPTTATFTSNVVATSDKTIKVYLNDIITSLSAADFEIEKDGADTWVAPAQATVETVDGKSVVTLTLSDTNKMSKALWGDVTPVGVRTVSSTGTPGAAAGTANADGIKVQFAATDSSDAIAPELATTNPITTIDADGDGKIDHIKVSFTEKLDRGYVSTDKFTVDGYTVTNAQTSTVPPNDDAQGNLNGNNSTDVYITVTEKSSVDSDVTPSVSIASGIKDLAGNAFSSQSSVASVDAAAPVITSVAIGGTADEAVTAQDTITITFSEATNKPTLTDASFTVGATHVLDLANNGSAVWNTDGTVLTITLGDTPTIDATDTINFATGSTVEDANGVEFGTSVIYTVPTLTGSDW